jgi:hypothetical protein
MITCVRAYRGFIEVGGNVGTVVTLDGVAIPASAL